MRKLAVQRFTSNNKELLRPTNPPSEQTIIRAHNHIGLVRACQRPVRGLRGLSPEQGRELRMRGYARHIAMSPLIVLYMDAATTSLATHNLN